MGFIGLECLDFWRLVSVWDSEVHLSGFWWLEFFGVSASGKGSGILRLHDRSQVSTHSREVY